jgi:hypothetical protein
MSGERGGPDGGPGPPQPPGEEPAATFVRDSGDQRTQDLLRAPSLGTEGGGDPDLPRLRPDELLAGRFSIIRFIARGGMGAVYEAEDLSLRTRVAHPNVCHVYEFYEARRSTGGWPAMRDASGRSSSCPCSIEMTGGALRAALRARPPARSD